MEKINLKKENMVNYHVNYNVTGKVEILYFSRAVYLRRLEPEMAGYLGVMHTYLRSLL